MRREGRVEGWVEGREVERDEGRGEREGAYCVHAAWSERRQCTAARSETRKRR